MFLVRISRECVEFSAILYKREKADDDIVGEVRINLQNDITHQHPEKDTHSGPRKLALLTSGGSASASHTACMSSKSAFGSPGMTSDEIGRGQSIV